MKSSSVLSMHQGGRRTVMALAVTIAMVLGLMPGVAVAGWWRYIEPELVSVGESGEPGDADSVNPSITDDGRFVVFDSDAGNLSSDDMNTGGEGYRDVFLRDRTGGVTDLVSVTPADALDSQRGARTPSISDDGRYVAFFTGRDLVPEDQNSGQDLYVKDLETGEYAWLDARGDGSAIGDYVYDIRISGDGEHVLFEVDWTNLLPDDTNSRRDVYLWSWMTDELVLVSDTPDTASTTDRGAQSGGISDDGSVVAFLTGRDFVPEDVNGNQDLYLWDSETGDFLWQDLAGDGSAVGSGDFVSISGDGEYVVLTLDNGLALEDTNGRNDVYLWSIADEMLTWVSETPEWASETDRGANQGTISDDGSVVAFFTGRDFVPEDENGEQDIYVRDMVTGEFRRVVITEDGSSPGNDIDTLALSGDGQWLALEWEYGDVKRMGAEYYDPSADADAVAAQVTLENEQVYVINIGDAFEPGADRVSGLNRYLTAIDVSKTTFPMGADTVVIATGTNWPDALCASALAGAVVGPVLLTRPDSLPSEVALELERLGAKHAYVIGSSAAISEAVEDELNARLAGYVVRLAGDTRYSTSRAVANRVIDILGPSYSGMALVTTGANYADALAGAPLAAGLDWPVLLAKPETGAVYLPADTDSAMILGSTKAVPASVETFLKTELGTDAVVRVGGLNRYDTAAQVAQAGVDAGLLWNGVGVASGESYPDGLTGGVAVGLQRSVLLLTPATSLSDYAADALETNKADIETVRFFGGPNALATVVENAINSILGL